MTVDNLIKELQKLPLDRLVYYRTGEYNGSIQLISSVSIPHPGTMENPHSSVVIA